MLFPACEGLDADGFPLSDKLLAQQALENCPWPDITCEVQRTARDHATLDREIYIQRKRMRRVMGFFRERHISETMGLEPLD